MDEQFTLKTLEKSEPTSNLCLERNLIKIDKFILVYVQFSNAYIIISLRFQFSYIVALILNLKPVGSV